MLKQLNPNQKVELQPGEYLVETHILASSGFDGFNANDHTRYLMDVRTAADELNRACYSGQWQYDSDNQGTTLHALQFKGSTKTFLCASVEDKRELRSLCVHL